ncbi:MAG: DUF456 domain-containing protein [Candidatus Omnitrophota bacterium]
MEIAALIILIVFSLIGFTAIFFTTFGTFLIFIGSALSAVMTSFSILSFKTILVLLTLYLCGEVLEYLFIIVGAKKFGASNAAVVGAIIGGILGAIFGSLLFGVGLFLGTILGIFLGAFFVELLLQKSFVDSLKAAAGGVLGRLGSIAIKFLIAVIMLIIIISKLIASSAI